jgi:bacillithiol system protein YtxJ
LIAYRSLSNKIAEDLKVHHESPQVLVIKNGDCVYDESHLAIYMEEIAEQVA